MKRKPKTGQQARKSPGSAFLERHGFVRLEVPITPAERRLIAQAAAKEGHRGMATFARRILVSAAKIIIEN